MHTTFNSTNLEEAQKTSVAPWDDLVWQDFHIAVYRDRYPVTPGHLLFVPKYNEPAIISQALSSALFEGNRLVDAGECSGFNIGLNMGTDAGQTVMYPHVHLIPRRKGDCEDPVGGVRGVIPGQANYKSTAYKNIVYK
jgi:diadenosine tetraphosphate (Ap4A) HIT family hydrolase